MDEFSEALNEIENFERRGDLQTALKKYREELLRFDSYPSQAVLYFRLARCLLETELDEAEDASSQSRRYSELAEDELLLGRIDLLDARLATLRGRHKAAQKYLQAADERLANSQEDQTYLLLVHATVERHRGELNYSVECLSRIDQAELEERPLLKAEYLDELGATHLAAGDFDVAIEVLTEAADLDLRLNTNAYASARSRLLLAGAHLGKGDRRSSKLLIEQVRDSFGGSTAGLSDMYALRGQWHEDGNEFAMAARDYRNGLDCDRESDDEIGQINALGHLARIRRKQGNILGAEESLEEGWNLARSNDDDVIQAALFTEEGELALDQCDYQRAIDKFSRALAIATDDQNERSAAIARRHLARAMWEDGQLERAEEMLRESRAVFFERGDLAQLNELLDDLGEVLIERDQYQAAVEVIRESLEIDERLGTISSQARSLALLGRAFLKLGDRVRAGDHIRRAADVYHNSEDAAGRGDVLSELGNWLFLEGRLREAKNVFQDALRIDVRHDDKIGMVRALRGLGAVYRSMGDLRRSRESLQEAAEVLKGKQDRSEQAHLNLEFGQLLNSEGETLEAERQLKTAMTQFAEIDSPVESATCQRLLGQIYGYDAGRYRLSLDYLEQAKEVFEKFGDTPELDQVYDDFGRVYLRMNRLGDAQSAVEKSLNIGIVNGWQHGKGDSYVLMGEICMAREDQDGALKNFTTALRVFEEVGDEAGISNAHLELGDLSKATGEYDDALIHYRAARQIDQVHLDFRGLARVFRKLGDVYFIRREFQRAEESYDQAEENLSHFRDPSQEARLALSRGILAAQLNKHVAAISLFLSSQELFLELEDSASTIMTYQCLSSSYYALGRFEEAIACQSDMGLEQASLWESLLQSFHPKVVAASKEQFLNQDYSGSVTSAFGVVEVLFRETDQGEGHRSISQVIREWCTVDRRGLPPFNQEQELKCYEQFCCGAFGLIRNPVTHHRWQSVTSTDAMAAISVAHLMARFIKATDEFPGAL